MEIVARVAARAPVTAHDTPPEGGQPGRYTVRDGRLSRLQSPPPSARHRIETSDMRYGVEILIEIMALQHALQLVRQVDRLLASLMRVPMLQRRLLLPLVRSLKLPSLI